MVGLLVPESVQALRGKQITPYLMNKACLVKSVSQNLKNHHKEAYDALFWACEQTL